MNNIQICPNRNIQKHPIHKHLRPLSIPHSLPNNMNSPPIGRSREGIFRVLFIGEVGIFSVARGEVGGKEERGEKKEEKGFHGGHHETPQNQKVKRKRLLILASPYHHINFTTKPSHPIQRLNHDA